MAQAVRLRYEVYADAAALSAASAERFARAAAEAAEARGVARIAVSGGSTPKTMFALLADRGRPYFVQVPWERLELYWVDERCVGPEDADSNYRMTREAMLDRVPLKAEQVHRMEGELDPEVAAARYEALLRSHFRLEGAETPTFDLVLLGMGDDGHTASLFPHTEALSAMQSLVVANHVPQKETWRVTLTWPVINRARRVQFEVAGAAKAQTVHDVFVGEYDPEAKPAQLIRPESGELSLLLDRAAARELPPTAEDGAGELELGSN